MPPLLRQHLSRPRLELLFALLAVAWLAWLGQGFGGADWVRGADDRYRRDLELRLNLPPDARLNGWVREVCGGFGDWLPGGAGDVCGELHRPSKFAQLRDQIPGLARPAAPLPPVKPVDSAAIDRMRETLPKLEAVHQALLKTLAEPLAATRRELREWEEHAGEGFGDDSIEDEIRNAQEETRLYREAYRLEMRGGGVFPKPLECAWSYLARQLATNPGRDAAPALALAGLAALLDGDGDKLPRGAFPAGRGWDAGETKRGCAKSSQGDTVLPLDAARDGAALMALARVSATNAAKASAAQTLPAQARWQLAAWALAGLMALVMGRRAARPNRVLFAALLVWAVTAMLTRPHLEWLGGGGSGLLAGVWQAPLALSALAGATLKWGPKRPVLATYPSSALGYPGFVLFAGLGWWLLLDLSAFGHFDNRFHGLYQQGYVFAAFIAVSLIPALRVPLAGFGLRWLSFWPLVAAGRTGRVLAAWIVALLAAGGALLMVSLALWHQRFLTSEIFRLCLVVGLSWFLLARGEALFSPWLCWPNVPPEQWPRLKTRLRLAACRLKFAAPLVPLLLFVLGGLLLTDDNGPLLVIIYSASIFAGVGMAVFVARWTGWPVGLAAGLATVGAYLWTVSWALLSFGGHLGTRIQERVASAQAPFLASNDQMARVLWFQEAAGEAGGFGFGGVPWCGDAVGSCRGVPPQIQSDYMFTALVGVFGPWLAWTLLALFGLWLWRLARSHPAATTGRADAADPGQAWLSWLTLCWVGLTLTQVAVTTAGNLCWLPLTGITFPFVSYGSWSLLANAALLGLALNLNRKSP